MGQPLAEVLFWIQEVFWVMAVSSPSVAPPSGFLAAFLQAPIFHQFIS